MTLLFLFESEMIDFFTPVEVSSKDEHHHDLYEIDKYSDDPFMPTSVRIESLGDHRKKIMHWLKNMPISLRVHKLTFTNKEFACLLMTMFDRSMASSDCLREFGIYFCPEAGFKIMEQRFISKPNPVLLAAEQKLRDSILISHRYSRFDSVSVSNALASDINQLFELFDIIQNGVSNELTVNNYENYMKDGSGSQLMFYNPLDHDSKVTKTVGLWFVEVIKKNLCAQYFKQHKQQSGAIVTSSYLMNSYSCIGNKERPHCLITQQFKEKSKLFKKHWQSMDKSKRFQYLSSIVSRDIRPILNQYRSTIKISSESFPSMKFSYPEDMICFIEDLVNLDPQYLLQELAYTWISEATFDSTLIKFEIILEIQNDVQRKKKEELFIVKKKINKLVSRKNSNSNSKDNQKGKTIKQQKIISTILPKKKTSEICEQVIENESIAEATQNTKLRQKKNKNKKKSKKATRTNSKPISETTNDQDSSQKSEIMDESVEIFNCDMPQFVPSAPTCQKSFMKTVTQFEHRTGKWNKSQQIAINRIASILHSYNLSYNLFGSIANGLAIAYSDVDICVDPTIVHYFYTSFCSYKDKIVMALQFLENCFRHTAWATNFNLISTASVPVLAFEIDLSVPYGDPNNLYFNEQNNQKCSKIYVDITIEPFANMQKQCSTHLGYQSTALVRQWVSQYAQLGRLVRILKHILASNGLHKSFQGGLSSYALTSMLYCFMRGSPSRRDQSLLELTAEFCKFINSFNQYSTIMQVHNQQEPFQSCNVDRLTVENCLNGKNLTENCYRFDEIKQLLGDIGNWIAGQPDQNTKTFNQKQYVKKLRSLLLD